MILFPVLGICLSLFLIPLLQKEANNISQESNGDVEGLLSILSQEERKDLESMFEHFFFFDGFAYSLFGTKSMSIGRLLPTSKMKRGWDAWEKVAPFFKSDKFVIRKYTFNEENFVLIANLTEMEEVYSKNRMFFDRAFHGGITLDSLKASIKTENFLFQELIGDQLLLGILLGYGTNNAQIFSENNTLPNNKKIPLKPFSKGHPFLYYFSPIMPPFFACDPNSTETLELKKRYKEERAAIVSKGNGRELFRKMLVLLSGEKE